MQVCIKVDDLHQRVNACVGSSGAEGSDDTPGKPLESQLKLVLYGIARHLALPAFVRTAVIAKTERNSQSTAENELMPAWVFSSVTGVRHRPVRTTQTSALRNA